MPLYEAFNLGGWLWQELRLGWWLAMAMLVVGYGYIKGFAVIVL